MVLFESFFETRVMICHFTELVNFSIANEIFSRFNER